MREDARKRLNDKLATIVGEPVPADIQYQPGDYVLLSHMGKARRLGKAELRWKGPLCSERSGRTEYIQD